MPLKDWNLKSTWDAAYHFGAEGKIGGYFPSVRDEVTLHYNRATKWPSAWAHAQRLAAALEWTPPGPTICIFGAGFGWTAEALEALGFLTVVGVDTSTFIQDNKNSTEETEIDDALIAVGLDPDVGAGFWDGPAVKARLLAIGGGTGNRSRGSRGVLNESGRTGGSRGRIKQALGLQGNERIEWVVSEAVLSSLTDVEALDASNDLDIIGNNTAHFVHKLKPGGDPTFNWHTLEEWKLLLPSDTFVQAGTYRVL